MHSNLSKSKGVWAVELIGGPDEENIVKKFPAGREHATIWLRSLNNGTVKMPAFKKKGAKVKPTTKVSPKKK